MIPLLDEGQVARWEALRAKIGAPEPRRRRLTVGFAWYDFWIGVFYDREQRIVYVCPLPCLLITYRRRPAP